MNDLQPYGRDKRVAILQSNYVPWKGYFDLIRSVDEFVLYDDSQFTKRDWRNRNKIKTQQGTQWLTIPVLMSGRFGQTIGATLVKDSRWARAHLLTLLQAYARAPYLTTYRERLEHAYAKAATLELLSEINYLFLALICEILEIRTRITWSHQYRLEGDRTGRLVNLCKQTGATVYLSGPAAREYLDEAQFVAAGITVAYADYSGYPAYEQLHPPFEHGVSVLDLLFTVGPAATEHMKLLL